MLIQISGQWIDPTAVIAIEQAADGEGSTVVFRAPEHRYGQRAAPYTLDVTAAPILVGNRVNAELARLESISERAMLNLATGGDHDDDR